MPNHRRCPPTPPNSPTAPKKLKAAFFQPPADLFPVDPFMSMGVYSTLEIGQVSAPVQQILSVPHLTQEQKDNYMLDMPLQ